MDKHDVIHKPEIHNVLYCRRRTTGLYCHVEHVQKMSWSLDLSFFWDMRANRQKYM